jgi:hypothetical protein
MQAKFSFSYYRQMLNQAIDAGYRCTSFANYSESSSRTVIVRHDVDYTLNGVREMAEIERSLGINASYFFRVHANEYNLFSPYVQQLLRHLMMLGHEIGLHFEAMSVGRALAVDPPDLLRREIKILELACGKAIESVSEHRDISQVVHSTPNFHDIYDPLDSGVKRYALEPRFFKEMKYLSDSNGVWREGDLSMHLGFHSRFQILVHPDWWFEHDLLLKGPYVHGLGNGAA